MEVSLLMVNVDQEATGKRLGELRRAAGLSSQYVADCLFISRGAVHKWEDGTNVPTIDNLVRLKYLYNVEKIDDLIVEGQ